MEITLKEMVCKIMSMHNTLYRRCTCCRGPNVKRLNGDESLMREGNVIIIYKYQC